jgi:hypothetical protein
MDTRHPSKIAPEQMYAVRILALRDKQITMSTLWQGQEKRVVGLVIYFALAIAFFAWIGVPNVALLMLGIFIGALADKVGIVLGQQKIWPMQIKITDWNKVERMAAGESLGD